MRGFGGDGGEGGSGLICFGGVVVKCDSQLIWLRSCFVEILWVFDVSFFLKNICPSVVHANLY
jgi:hypothetical protein